MNSGTRVRNTILVAIALLLAGPCATTSAAVTSDLATPQKKEIAMELVSSAENSTVDWRSQFGYIEDIHDGRGYTGGIIAFTSRTGDMLELVRIYTRVRPHNPLARFLPALRRVNGSASHRGLGPRFVRAWKRAAKDRAFQRAQEELRDRDYFDPAVNLAKQDGLRALGQFCYYDATVVHGFDRLQAIRRRALARAQPPPLGGDEVTYLNAFLDERDVEMLKEKAHSDLSRVKTEQRKFLREGNLDLNAPLSWFTYGDQYTIPA